MGNVLGRQRGESQNIRSISSKHFLKFLLFTR